MKTLKVAFNPSNALSILLAAVFLRDHAYAEVSTTEKDGTDFEKKIQDETGREIVSHAVYLLTDEKESEKAKQLELGILSSYNDPTDFDQQQKLFYIFSGNGEETLAAMKAGKTIIAYENSPYVAGKPTDAPDDLFEEQEVDEIAGTPIDSDDLVESKRGNFVWADKNKDKVVFEESAEGRWLIVAAEPKSDVVKEEKPAAAAKEKKTDVKP